jgi:hypothetical protein
VAAKHGEVCEKYICSDDNHQLTLQLRVFIINMTANEIKRQQSPATNGMQAEKMSSQSAEALLRTVSILQYYFYRGFFLCRTHTHMFTGQFFQHF